ncbi:hypothetical protein [Prauserella alba]|uniref:Uncharacterized protein n=1 Tax=Prauserella alba TaxID=176898 RepID=A0ABP4G0F8_9PSEU|nr:hypothetical protein [Prauserella alba]MCP2180014.1 hypothetical protein [Prauserella alba]
MRTARITDRTAREAVEFATDDYISAVQEEELAMDERDEADRVVSEALPNIAGTARRFSRRIELGDSRRRIVRLRPVRRSHDPHTTRPLTGEEAA